MPDRMTVIGFFIFPGMLQMDFTGPYGVLASGPDTRIHLIWHEKNTLRSSDGLALQPDTLPDECPRLDVLCVPGGGGVTSLMEHPPTLRFLRDQGKIARYVTSVCTGALLLGAAGLLLNRQATTHWQSLDLLPLFGARPIKQRFVRDGNLISASGVSAGIDMALALAASLWGDDAAMGIQLSMEYAPEPPFAAGTPKTAPQAVVARIREQGRLRQVQRKEAALRAASLLPGFDTIVPG